MSQPKRNTPRGTVPCIAPSCTAIASALQYRAGEVDKLQRRRAGKFYLNCPSCGVIRCDGASMQDYILEHITWLEENDTAPAPAESSSSEPPPEKQQKTPARPKRQPPASSPETPAQAPAEPPDLWNM